MRRQLARGHASRKFQHLPGTFRDLHSAVTVAGVFRIPKLMDPLQVLRLLTVRQITGETDAVESFRQNMLQEQFDEVSTFYSQDLLAVIVRIIFIAENRILSPTLFEGVSESNVECKLYRLCQELNITKRSPHKWRKTYISHLLNNGVDPDFVREQVGHKDLQTTYNSYTYTGGFITKQMLELYGKTYVTFRKRSQQRLPQPESNGISL